MAVTARTIIADAAAELNVTASGEILDAADAESLRGVLARLIDNWNAEREAIYATDFLTFTFVPGLNPHTIGPTGAWVVSARPVTIEGATVVLTPGAHQINAPRIRLHDQSVGLPSLFQSVTRLLSTTGRSQASGKK